MHLKKGFLTLLVLVLFLLGIKADALAAQKGKIILISLNRSDLSDYLDIDSLYKEMNKRGFIGLMNIRADQGISDIKSYGSLGSGNRALINPSDIDFQELREDNQNIYLRRTNMPPKAINNLGVNVALADNLTGEYGATIGALGLELRNKNLNISVLGNADTDLEIHREACLIASDENGQIPSGNINLNTQDSSMPFGIRTDYNKLMSETKKYYESSNVLVVELGDTYRLDLYKVNLNENAYLNMKQKIYDNISVYLDGVFKMAGENDKIYILSPLPKTLSYQKGFRLSPVVVFNNKDKGIIVSSTTRRDGILSNTDIPVDMLNNFDITSPLMFGKKLNFKVMDNAYDYLNKDYSKIVATGNVRITTLYTYAVIEMIIWLIALISIFNRKKIPDKAFNILSCTLKATMAMPLVFLIAPLFNFKNEYEIVLSIIFIPILIYYILNMLIKDDLKKLVVISILTSLVVLIDVATGQYLMKNSVLGYDVIVGARYYGVGNEYEGVILGVLVFALAGLLEYKKINKGLATIVLMLGLLIEILPNMGADVGGIFSGGFCFLYFILKMYDVKIDFRKFAIICIAIAGGVVAMAIVDTLFMGSKSHLAGLVQNISDNGPIVIVKMLQRKVEMNMKLISISIWSKVLILAVIIVAVLFNRPFGMLKELCDRHPMLAKAWSSIVVGCTVGLLANDSGVIVAATGITYVVIPVLVLIIKNRKILSDD